MAGQRGAWGGTLEQVLARAARPDKPPEPYDDDDRQAALLTRGYSPGLIFQLSQQLADCEAERQAEVEKIEKGERRAEHVRRAHEAGRIHALDIPAALGDEGDPGRVAHLERRARNLRQQIEDAQAAIAPPRARDLDAVEAASRRASSVLAEVSRSQVAEARERSRPQERPPFDSVSRGRSTEHVPDGYCWVCVEGRRLDAARARADVAAYAPGSVITTGYAEIAR